MIRRTDEWIGKNVFHPPIIKMLQNVPNMTQYSVGRDIATLGWFSMLYTAIALDLGLFFITIDGIILLCFMIRSICIPANKPVYSYYGVRIMWYVYLILLTLLPYILIGASPLYIMFALCMLTSEYCFTIKNIPPKEKKVKHGSVYRSPKAV